jgi:rhodanese-related sulfurtransferase
VQIEELLDEARAGLGRLSPAEAHAAVSGPDAVLADIREDHQRERDGLVPGAIVVARNVLEWRCAPDSQWRDERLSDPERMLVLICQEGYQSSLAAATLQRLGLPRATDVDGGFEAWAAAGLPVE